MTLQDKLKQHLKHINADILTHSYVFKTMHDSERHYHEGKADEAEGIKVAFLLLFGEEMKC